MNVHIHIHHDIDSTLANQMGRVIRRLDRIEENTQQSIEQLDSLKQIEELHMRMDAATAARLDAATTKIAARLQKLLDTREEPLTDEQAAAIEADIAALEAMGHDPNDPIPPVPGEPVEDPPPAPTGGDTLSR